MRGHICDPGQRRPLYDARRIFCCYVCDTCETAKRQQFRSDIFTDPAYEVCELIDDE